MGIVRFDFDSSGTHHTTKDNPPSHFYIHVNQYHKAFYNQIHVGLIII